MPRFLVAGLINIETTLRVDAFPLAFETQRFPFYGIQTTVSGVGYNVSKALCGLGNAVDFLALNGTDPAGELVTAALARDGIPAANVAPLLAETPQSVILYDPAGRRMSSTDLKDIQERAYPPERFQAALEGCDIAVLTTINFARPWLRPARALGKLVAVDAHAIGDPDDDYNRDYMAAADILFLSHELLICAPEEFAEELLARYRPRVLVMGLGAEGALLVVPGDNFAGRFPVVSTRPVVNTIGAGDALFSAFLHGYAQGSDPYTALRRAIVFASWKIGVRSAAEGFPAPAQWADLCAERGI
jgi:ribokinase